MAEIGFDANKLVPEDKERLTRSAALIGNPLGYNHPLKDNMFTLGRVTRRRELVTVDIDDDTPTATFDDAVVDAIRAVYGRTIPTIYDFAKKRQLDPELTLLNGGSMIWVKQGDTSRLVLLQRQIYKMDNPEYGFVVAPGQYITPVGHADKAHLQVCMSEGAEELVLLVTPGTNTAAFNALAKGRNVDAVPLLISFNDQTGVTPDEKMEIISKLRQKLFERGEGDMFPQTLSDGPAIIKAHLRPEDEAKLSTVQTRINGSIIEEFRAVAFHESAASSIQFNIPYEIELPPGLKVLAFNGEAPGRKVALMTTQEIRDEIRRKADNPEAPGGIFVSNRGYIGDVGKDYFDNDVPRYLQNRNNHYEGPFKPLQEELMRRHAQAMALKSA